MFDICGSQEHLIEMGMKDVSAFPENDFTLEFKIFANMAGCLIRSIPSDLFSVWDLIRTDRHLLHDWVCLKSPTTHTT